MGLVKGVLKLIGGMAEAWKGAILSDGPTLICPRCGTPYQGFCRNCSTKTGGKLMNEGLDEITEYLKR